MFLYIVNKLSTEMFRCFSLYILFTCQIIYADGITIKWKIFNLIHFISNCVSESYHTTLSMLELVDFHNSVAILRKFLVLLMAYIQVLYS